MLSSRTMPVSSQLSKGSGRGADKGCRGAPLETSSAGAAVAGVAHTVISLQSTSKEATYAQRAAQSAAAAAAAAASSGYGHGRERCMQSASSSRGPRASSCGASPTAPVVVAPMVSSAHSSNDTARRLDWEEFVIHRHETRLQIESLADSREQHRLSDAHAQRAIEELGHALEARTQDVHTILDQYNELDSALKSDHEAIDAIQRSLNHLEQTVHEEAGRRDQQHEAVIRAMRQGDRAIADELLSKMAELNEKLGANMQALEDELATDLQGMAERIDKTLAAPHPASGELAAARVSADQLAAMAADAAKQVSAAELSLNQARAHIDNLMLEAREDLKVAVSLQVTELEERLGINLAAASSNSCVTSSASEDLVQDLRAEFQNGLSALRALCKEVDVKSASEAESSRSCAASIARESHRASEQLHEELDELRSICAKNESASVKTAREELHFKLDEMSHAREDFVSSVEEALQDMRNELQSKMQDIATTPGITAIISEAVEGVQCDMRAGLEDEQEARRRLAVLVEEAAIDIKNMRAEVSLAIDKSQGACRLTAAAEKAVCDVRDELGAKFEEVRSAREQMSTTFEEALTAVRSELDSGLGDSKDSSSRLQARLSEERQDREALSQTLNSSVQEVEHSLREAVLKIHKELQEGLDQARVDCGRMQSETETNVRGATQELCAGMANTGDQSAVEGIAAKLHELESKCDSHRNESIEEADSMKQRVNTFCEEIVEMVADLNNQACAGCVEVQQGLEISVARLSAFSEDAQSRFQALEKDPGLGCATASPTSQSSCHSKDDLVEAPHCKESGESSSKLEVEKPLAESARRLNVLEDRVAELSGAMRQDAGALGENRGQIRALEEQLNATCSNIHQDSMKLDRQLGDYGARLESMAANVGKMRAQLDMLEPRVDAACRAAHDSSMSSSPIRLDRPLESSRCDLSPNLVTSPTTLSENQDLLASLEERLDATEDAARRHLAELDGRLDAVEGGVAGWPGTMSDMQLHLNSLEERLEERSAEGRDENKISPKTRADNESLAGLREEVAAHSRQLSAHAARLEPTPNRCDASAVRLATLEHRCESMTEKLSSIEDLLAAGDAGTSELASLPASSHQRDSLAAIEEQLAAVQAAATKEKFHVERRLEAQAGDLAGMRRAVAELTNDVFKVQGCADAAYAEATREQNQSVRCEWKEELEQTQVEWKAMLSDAVQSECQMIVAASEDKTALKMKNLTEKLRSQCREWVDVVADKVANLSPLGNTSPTKQPSIDLEQQCGLYVQEQLAEWKTTLGEVVQSKCQMIVDASEHRTASKMKNLNEKLRSQCQEWVDEVADKVANLNPLEDTAPTKQPSADLEQQCRLCVEEQLVEVAQSQARHVELLRGEIESVHEETQAEAERIWEAINAQAGGATERSETLALETQRQCRTWVDGALRKLEDLALRTKERIAGLAVAAEQREVRLEARMEAALKQRGGAAHAEEAVVEPASAEKTAQDSESDARSARLAVAAERRESRLAAKIRESQQQGQSAGAPTSPEAGRATAESLPAPNSAQRPGVE